MSVGVYHLNDFFKHEGFFMIHSVIWIVALIVTGLSCVTGYAKEDVFNRQRCFLITGGSFRAVLAWRSLLDG
jgi:hypothetical protein